MINNAYSGVTNWKEVWTSCASSAPTVSDMARIKRGKLFGGLPSRYYRAR